MLTVNYSLGSHTVGGDDDYMRYYTPGEGDVVVDAGAHMGLWTRRFSKLVGDTGRVIAIDPDYKALGLLLLNMEDKNNVTILPYALWEEDGIIQVSLHGDNSIGTTSCAVEYNTGWNYNVRSRSLDSILLEQNIDHVNFLKMDIEAAEIQALHGMTESFCNIDALAIAAYHEIFSNNPAYSKVIYKATEGKTYPVVEKILQKAGFNTRTEISGDGEIVYANKYDFE